MKILIISPKFDPVIGGGETFVLNSIERLHGAGQEVAVAVEPHPQRNVEDYPYPVFEIPGLSDSHLDVIQAPDGLYQLLQSYQPDIIHVHGYFGLLAVALTGQDTPVIVSVHSTPVWGQRIIGGMLGFDQERSFAEQILRFALPKVMTGANDVYTDAARKLAPKEVAVEYFPYPIQPVFYESHDGSHYRDEFKLRKTDILLTLPGRIIERKGVREAAYALNHLPDNYYLCLPAAFQPLDEPYWQSILTSSEYQAVKNRVIVPAHEILHEQMPALYAASDVIVMPSYYEGAPVATVETMAARRPLVAADAQGINGFIRHMENGILVPQKGVIELAEAILLVAQDAGLQDRLTAQAAKDVAHLSWEVQLPKLLELYRSHVIRKE